MVTVVPHGVVIAAQGAAACVTCAGAASLAACLQLMRGAAVSALDCIKEVKLTPDTIRSKMTPETKCL